MSARNRELFGLLPVTLLVTAGFTAVLITRSRDINKVTITYGAIFLGACVSISEIWRRRSSSICSAVGASSVPAIVS